MSSLQRNMEEQVYLIHDNGSRPFRVTVRPRNIVHVELNMDDIEGPDTYCGPSVNLTINADEVFIGESPRCDMTIWSGGHGPNFKGNSILVKEGEKYIHIGSCIFEFYAKARIIEYVALVGNSNVPYQHAIDKEGNAYLFAERVIILSATTLTMTHADDMYDIYRYYYDNHYLTPHDGHVGYAGITAYRIGDENHEMTYHPNAKWLFNWSRGEGPVHEEMTIMIDGAEIELFQHTYCDLMNKFAKSKGFEPLEHTIIVKRPGW